MEVLGGTASVIAVVQLTAAIIKICGLYLIEVKDAEREINSIINEVQTSGILLTQVEEALQGPVGEKLKTSQSLREALSCGRNDLQKLKEKLENGLDEKDKRKKSFWHKKAVSLRWPFHSKEVRIIVGNLEKLKSAIDFALQIDNAVVVHGIDQSSNLHRLSVVKGAIFGSAEDQWEPECLPDTRVEVLKAIDDWASDTQNQSLYWLRGMAGTGKSSIARTIARNFKDKRQLGASFFFKKSQADRNNASKLFSTLAYSLLHHIPALRPHISRAIEETPDISDKRFKDQFEALLMGPLSKISSESIVLIVIDALDECENENEIPLVLNFLGQLVKLSTVNIRVFVTSRPEFGPLKGFQSLKDSNVQYHDLALHDVDQVIVRHDITEFLRTELTRIRTSEGLEKSWPGEQVIQRLVEMAEPLFISAATICRFVNDQYNPPQENLDTLLASNTVCYGYLGVYQIYLTIIETFSVRTHRHGRNYDPVQTQGFPFNSEYTPPFGCSHQNVPSLASRFPSQS